MTGPDLQVIEGALKECTAEQARLRTAIREMSVGTNRRAYNKALRDLDALNRQVLFLVELRGRFT